MHGQSREPRLLLRGTLSQNIKQNNNYNEEGVGGEEGREGEGTRSFV